MSTLTKNGEAITLEYDLYDLPTAQHKAGLAGLLLMIESMKMRKMTPLPEYELLSSSCARVEFTLESMTAVFADLYKGKEIETKKGARVIPALDYLSALGLEDIWIKAWQDCIFSVIRKPRAWAVYQTGHDAQDEFKKLQKPKSKDIPASLILAGEGTNAELVTMKGRPKDTFLLHFTLIPSLLFVPVFLTKESDRWVPSMQIGTSRRGPFFVIAIPEPRDLKYFLQDAQSLLKQGLGSETWAYRPRAALIHVPEEASLEYLWRLTSQRVSTSGKGAFEYSSVAVESYYLEKQGKNNIRTLAAQRISPDEQILRGYDALRKQYRNPLYRSQRIRNLLSQQPWHTGMDGVFNQYPWEFFVSKQGKTPQTIPFFGYDVKSTFTSFESNLRNRNSEKGGDPMSAEVYDERLASCVYRLTQEYVHRRTEKKSGEKYKEFQNNRDSNGRIVYPEKYHKAQEDVCSDAFLTMRGRREQDFVEYFTGTICSVAQYLPEADYLIVSRALIDEPNTVKTLAMLALSASSAVGRASENETKKEGG